MSDEGISPRKVGLPKSYATLDKERPVQTFDRLETPLTKKDCERATGVQHVGSRNKSKLSFLW
jgi:hypothetical protein